MALLSLFTGCWTEIEYRETAPVATAAEHEATPTPPDQTAAPIAETAPGESPPVKEPPAETLAAEEPTMGVPPTDTDTASDSSDVGRRYASTGATSEPAETIASPTDSDFEPAGSPEPEATTDAMTDENTSTGATVETNQRQQAVSTRRAAWLLGSRLGLAALAHDRNIAQEETVAWLNEARTMAELLGTSITELPARPGTAGSAPASREVLSYLLSEGKRIGGELATKQGPDLASMFEVALKSNLLLVLNKPETPAAGHISAAIERAAPQARLPEELWRPLLVTVAQKSPPAAVRAAVRQMHAAVDAHLAAAPAEQ